MNVINRAGSYHFVGVAGSGMNALAQVMQAEGHAVSGSDRYHDTGQQTEITKKLHTAGVVFHPQDGTGVTDRTDAVVVSTAIEQDNPDILAAADRDIPVIHRSELLARLLYGKRCVAVTGTSGKSTVTGMIGWILECMDARPVVVNGAAVLNWLSERSIGNMKHGDSDLWVFEADESDRSLLNFHPDWAVITNASRDHFDLHSTLDLFDEFSRQVRTGLVSTVEDPAILAQFNPQTTRIGSQFSYRDVTFAIPLPGRHNAENAMLSAILCERLGYDLSAISVALSQFKGIQRRIETVGVADGITVVDDFAHNPAKIRAAWSALSQYHDRVLAIWRPHGFGPLSSMLQDLTDMFTDVCGKDDHIYVLPVYDAGGTADRSINSDALVKKLIEQKTAATYIDSMEEVVACISAAAQPRDVVLIMGARDPDLPVLARQILAQVSGD